MTQTEEVGLSSTKEVVNSKGPFKSPDEVKALTPFRIDIRRLQAVSD